MKILPKTRSLKMKWTFEEKDPVFSDSLLEKVAVDAGNIKEVIEDDYMVWHPSLDKQIDRLVGEWTNPDSDGTGFLTYFLLMSESVMAIREEIDKEI